MTTLLLNNNFYLLLYLNDRQDMTWQLMWDPKPHHRYITSRDSFSRTPHLEVKNAVKNFLGHISVSRLLNGQPWTFGGSDLSAWHTTSTTQPLLPYTTVYPSRTLCLRQTSPKWHLSKKCQSSLPAILNISLQSNFYNDVFSDRLNYVMWLCNCQEWNAM